MGGRAVQGGNVSSVAIMRRSDCQHVVGRGPVLCDDASRDGTDQDPQGEAACATHPDPLDDDGMCMDSRLRSSAVVRGRIFVDVPPSR